MKIDIYTKAVLTVIAAGMIALVAQNVSRPAYALGNGCGSGSDPCYIKSRNALAIKSSYGLDVNVDWPSFLNVKVKNWP